jgi:hypothetical protein
MRKGQRVLGLALALVVALLSVTVEAASVRSPQAGDAQERWDAIFRPAAEASHSCAATKAPQSCMARARVNNPALSPKQSSSCWCCAKIGDPTCCAACFPSND